MDTGTRAGGSRGGGLGSLGQEAVGKISHGAGLGWTPLGQNMTLCVESQKKRPEDDWTLKKCTFGITTALLFRKLEGNISSRGVADLSNTLSITKDGGPPRKKPR